jgi:hypothetical protein
MKSQPSHLCKVYGFGRFSFNGATHFLGEDVVRRNIVLIGLKLYEPGFPCPGCERSLWMTRPRDSYPHLATQPSG